MSRDDTRITEIPGAAEGITVLLTATIDPGGMPHTRRSDPAVRLQDYLAALEWWIRCEGVRKVMFCENSGYDLTPLIELAARAEHRRCAVAFLSFHGNAYPGNLGKGYGEVNILKRAVEALGLGAADEGFLKVTGRYTVANIGDVLDGVHRSGDREMFCNRYKGAFADTRVMFLRAAFLTRYVFPRQAEVRDAAGHCLEHVIADALQQARAEGVAWTRFSVRPIVQGISGTKNKPYAKPEAAWREDARLTPSS